MKKLVASLLVVAILMLSHAPAFAQQPPTPGHWGGRAVAVGLVTMLVGGIMFIPRGETFDVFGDEFCVSNNYRTYEDGPCYTSDARKKVATVVLLTGVGITYVGAMRVRVENKSVSASTTIRW